MRLNWFAISRPWMTRQHPRGRYCSPSLTVKRWPRFAARPACRGKSIRTHPGRSRNPSPPGAAALWYPPPPLEASRPEPALRLIAMARGTERLARHPILTGPVTREGGARAAADLLAPEAGTLIEASIRESWQQPRLHACTYAAARTDWRSRCLARSHTPRPTRLKDLRTKGLCALYARRGCCSQ